MVLHTGALKKIRTWKRHWRIQWGRWDCKSKEMSFGIVCHIEVLKLNHEAIVSSLRSMVVSLGAPMSGEPKKSLLPPQSPSVSSALARLYYFARPTKTAMLRSIGGKKRLFLQCISSVITGGSIGLTEREIRHATKDRDYWRHLVAAYRDNPN